MLNKPIGGFFELELKAGDHYHDNAINLNSGRNSLLYILQATSTKHVYIPRYICDSVTETLDTNGLSYSFYHVNSNFEIDSDDMPNLSKDEKLMYVNYFGIKDKYCGQLAELFKDSLILDCSQAFFYKPEKELKHVFYSPRKFFGVPDGGMVVSSSKLKIDLEKDNSVDRFTHLLKRIEDGPELAYPKYQLNEKNLSKIKLMKMSNLTEAVLKNVDYRHVMKLRKNNFSVLNSKLSGDNLLSLDPSLYTCPMVYPIKVESGNLRQELIKHKIFSPIYWPNNLETLQPDSNEYQLASKIVALPVDQRYGSEEMNMLADFVLDTVRSNK